MSLVAELREDRPDCYLCKLEQVSELDHMLANGATVKMVQAWLGNLGLKVVSRNTVSLHKTKHCKALVVRRASALRRDIKHLSSKAQMPRETDLARLVVERGKQRLLDPNDDMDVTVDQALRAADMIDRRGDRAADRELLYQLTAMISGSHHAQIIEGHSLPIEDLDEEREADEAEALRLGAP